MKNLYKFFVEIGKLKETKRTSWLLSGIKKPETVASHSFRLAMMAFVLGKNKKDLNMEKVLKIALVHNLCKVYAGDITPYDALLLKDEKKLKILRKEWPCLSKDQKVKISLEKYKKEWKSMIKLTSGLPIELKEEIINLFFDYKGDLNKEARFVHQVNRMESFIQALEYSEKKKNFHIKPWWRYIKERIDDPVLVKFLEEVGLEFKSKNEKKAKTRILKKKKK